MVDCGVWVQLSMNRLLWPAKQALGISKVPWLAKMEAGKTTWMKITRKLAMSSVSSQHSGNQFSRAERSVSTHCLSATPKSWVERARGHQMEGVGLNGGILGPRSRSLHRLSFLLLQIQGLKEHTHVWGGGGRADPTKRLLRFPAQLLWWGFKYIS